MRSTTTGRSKTASSPKTPAANVNGLVDDLQRAIRHDKGSVFSFNVELGQIAGREFRWRAYVSTDGRVRASSGLTHHEPEAAIAELLAKLKKGV